MQIDVGQGRFAIIDDDDYKFISRWKWYLKRGYAVRRGKSTDYRKIVTMHSQLCIAPPGFIVDHINRNPLDNRRENLRVATRTENSRNRGLPVNSTTGFKGVYWVASKRKYHAQIKASNKLHSLGLHETKESAAKAYNDAAIKHFGEFACLNELSQFKTGEHK